MLTSIAASPTFFVSSYAFPGLNFSTFPTIFLAVTPRTRTRTRTRTQPQDLSNLHSLRFCDFGKGGEYRRCCFGVVRRCKGREGEGDSALEEEILEFMRKSEKPEAFPTKKELVDAGRMDLVDAIAKQGGWLSLGWDLDDNDDEEESSKGDEITDWKSVMGERFGNGDVLRRMVDIGQESSALEGHEFRSFEVNSSQSASSSGRSLDSEAEDETGIEGILSRLEKQRNMTFGIDLREKGVGTHNSTDDGGNDWQHGSSIDGTVAGHDRSGRHASLSPKKGTLNDTGTKPSQTKIFSDYDGLENSLKPEMWRSWSIQRAGLPDSEFEAAEITFNRSGEVGVMDDSKQELLEIIDGTTETLDGQKELNSCGEKIKRNDIQVRLQHLELELASALGSLRCKSDELITQKGHDERSSEDLRKLSDAWEFQENEIMHAQGRMRSTRAKLAVLEGKMALAIIEAQKIVEEKQKRIDDARRALRILRTACIVWPNSASEVLIAGSFDGWATQRKMERSSTGIFSLCLKLYPGRYEIKFIVDGIWTIDPLRPVVHNNGYKNNLLLIT